MDRDRLCETVRRVLAVAYSDANATIVLEDGVWRLERPVLHRDLGLAAVAASRVYLEAVLGLQRVLRRRWLVVRVAELGSLERGALGVPGLEVLQRTDLRLFVS